MQIEFTIAALRIVAAALTIGVLWPILAPAWQRTRRAWADSATENTNHSKRKSR